MAACESDVTHNPMYMKDKGPSAACWCLTKGHYHGGHETQDQLRKLREEREAEVKKNQAEKEANLKAMRQESEETLARMRLEYEQSAAAWDRKLREMADILETQRGHCHTHELELHALKTELEARRAEIHNLEADNLTLEGQVESSRASIMNLEAARREQGLRIKELEYEVRDT